MQDGRMSGSRGQRKLWIWYSTYRMDPSTQVGPPWERPNRRYVCRNSSSITPYCLLQAALFESQNIFDNLPSLQAPKLAELHGELDNFLSTDPKHVTDALAWWYVHKDKYLCLHWMALDYLSIPGKFDYMLEIFLTMNCF